MRVFLQTNEQFLIVSFDGMASDSHRGFERESKIGSVIREEIARLDSKSLIVDFRDLNQIDSVSFRALLVLLGDLSSRLSVQMVGPGRGLGRLIALVSRLPAIHFFPSIAIARLSGVQSLQHDASGWQEFLAQFRGESGTAKDFQDSLPREFVVDLEEEAEYFRLERSEKDASRTLEFRGRDT